MPYATRKMLEYMKKQGMNTTNSEDDAASDVVSNANSPDNAGPNKKKIRELPNSVDPSDVDDEQEERSPGQKGGSVKSVSADSKKKTSKQKVKSAKPKSAKPKSAKPKSVSSKKKSSSTMSSSAKSSVSHEVKEKIVKASTMALKPVDVEVDVTNYDDMTLDEKKLQFIQSLLKSNVKRVKSLPASESVRECKKEFEAYTITKKEVAKSQTAKALYEATHRDFPKDCLVVCKQYDVKTFDPKNSLYLKILRHLGKKHPNIIQTWDVMSKDDTIYVFQELAPYGNMQSYVEKKGSLSETQTQWVARQIRNAMDFLGDMGIAHRAIRPAHVLIIHSDLQVKITGFRSSVIYYDEKRNEINFQPCIALKKKSKSLDYQAPEVYGNARTELFDPITADVWSFGASLFHLLSQAYPYNTEENSPKVGNEIQKNVLGLKVSKNGHSVIGHMLTIESTKRPSVDKLKENPWFKEK